MAPVEVVVYDAPPCVRCIEGDVCVVCVCSARATTPHAAAPPYEVLYARSVAHVCGRVRRSGPDDAPPERRVRRAPVRVLCLLTRGQRCGC